jgi:hypothetical protein
VPLSLRHIAVSIPVSFLFFTALSSLPASWFLQTLNNDAELIASFHHIVESARVAVHGERAYLYVVDRGRRQLLCVLPPDREGLAVPPTHGIVGLVARTGEPVCLSDALASQHYDAAVDGRCRCVVDAGVVCCVVLCCVVLCCVVLCCVVLCCVVLCCVVLCCVVLCLRQCVALRCVVMSLVPWKHLQSSCHCC